MNSSMKLLLALTAAAAAGAAIGMLLSPDKGKELQKKIKASASDWLSNFSSLLTTGKELVSEIKSKTERDQDMIRESAAQS